MLRQVYRLIARQHVVVATDLKMLLQRSLQIVPLSCPISLLKHQASCESGV